MHSLCLSCAALGLLVIKVAGLIYYSDDGIINILQCCMFSHNVINK